MGSVDKSIELYEMIISRLEASGNAPYQLEAYKGSLECFRGCATLQEAMDRLAASPWYTAVGKAVMLDDLWARRKAALELGQDDVAAAYDARIKEVDADYMKAWDTSYQAPIQQMQSAHLRAEEQKLEEKLNAIEARIEEIKARPAHDISADWQEVSSHRAEVKEIGKRELAKLRRGSAVAVPPEDNTGKYSFEQVREEAF